MIYFIGTSKDKFLKNFIFKIKNKACIQNVNVKDVSFCFLDVSKTRKSYLNNIFQDRQNIFFISEQLNLSYIYEYNENLHFQKNIDSCYKKSILYILNKIKNKDKKISFVYCDRIEDIIYTSIKEFRNIELIFEDIEKEEYVSNKILCEYGAIVSCKTFFDIISNSIIFNIEDKKLNLGNNNKIFCKNFFYYKDNVVFSDFNYSLKKIYLDVKPYFIDDITFYNILKLYTCFDDDLNVSMFNCKMNNEIKKLNQIIRLV